MNNAPVQIMQITQSSLTIYNEYQVRNSRTEKEIKNEINLTRGKFNGYLSNKAKREITKRLNYWLQALIFVNKRKPKLIKGRARKPVFVTLTLPAKQQHSDNEIKAKCLIPFIQSLKRHYHVKYYFWIAEAQKNGNLHFHLIIDCYVHHSYIRARWNSNLAKLGYIGRFFSAHGNNNPNSTDVHIVGGFGLAIKYVVKYVQKSKSFRPIEGRLHGISDELKIMKKFTTTIDNETSKFIDDAINQPKARVFLGEHFTVIFCEVFKLESFKESGISNEFESYLTDVYNYLYNDADPFRFKIIEQLEAFIEEDLNELKESKEAEMFAVQTSLCLTLGKEK